MSGDYPVAIKMGSTNVRSRSMVRTGRISAGPTNTRSHVLSNRFALGPVYLGHETTQHKLIRSSARSIPCNMVSFSVLVDVIR